MAIRVAIFILLACPSALPAQTGYEDLLARLFRLGPDPAQVARVDSLTIRRAEGLFRLGPGEMVLCTPADGRVVAAVYRGSGLFSFRPPSDIEQGQLSRFFGTDSVAEPFRFLFLMFGDSTATELNRGLSFTAGNPDRSLESEVRYALRYLGDEAKKEFAPEFVRTFLEATTNDLFYAHFSQERIDPLFFEINPFEPEDVRFMRRYPLDVKHLHEVVSQYSGRSENRERGEPDIASYTVDALIETDLSFHSAATLTLESAVNGWRPMLLYRKLEIDSIRSDKGEPVMFTRGNDSGLLWIRFEPDISSITVWYHGDLLSRDASDWIWIGSTYSWLPRASVRDRAMFQLTCDTPSSLELVASGSLLAREQNDDRTISRWETESPSRSIGFTPGYFEEVETEVGTNQGMEARVFVFRARLRHGPPAWAYAYGMRADGDYSDDVREDVVLSSNVFRHLFGEPATTTLRVAETPGLHGEAFPGMIQMSWATFRSSSLSREQHQIFRAHEVAHQWWGIGVDFSTYHDQWLSEGLSQYTGLWYMQTVSADNDLFFQTLDTWRDLIVSNRKFLFGSGQESGPIWLGYRTQGSETKGDYDLIIYRKGAWVFHMLRNLLIDLKTFNEETFKAILRDYYQSYSGRSASTEDFQRIVERHTGTSMDWFFRQWVYGTVVPSYRFAYRATERPDGRYQVTCRVEQHGAGPDFRMDVPIRITLADGSIFRIRKTITGSLSEFTLPLLPGEPEEVLFNDLRSVLCEVEHVDWEE